MGDVRAPHHAAEDREQPRVGKHLLCEDDEGVMHIVFGYSSGDAVQVSRSQYAESSARTMDIRRRVCVLGKLDDEKKIIRRQAWFCRKGVRGSRRGSKRSSKRWLPPGHQQIVGDLFETVMV